MAIEPMDDMPKITIERDDVESFQRARAQTKKTNGPKGNIPQESKNTHSNSPSWLMFILFLVVICSTAVYWSFEQHKVLVHAQQRITDLEGRLSATGEELDQSAVAIQVKVTELSKKTEELWEQMDKLWASAWRRNQSEISDLTNELKKLASKSDNAMKKLGDDASQQEGKVTTLSNQVTQLNQSLQAALETQAQLKRTSLNNEQQVASLREKLISSALGNNNLTNKVDELESKLLNLEKHVNKASSSQPIATP
ncbi:MAG: hypothetical protein NWQ54_25740 [Paraglaciecola sp.]|uniref:hypothetical protein n=1 Tax=Paraglaciecola sp. TaxID=1920173 RepID=UPI00273F4949|nr:hypothetical protein [Paraglaciecola sp.]MDP5031936.1 hypothetical protein [Paraglaciecola sp.]MDP5134300.1 hypothetical protein [Paraglaciecola sp.]